MKKKRNTFSVLIPDGEATLIYNVVYSFSLMKNVKIYVLSSHTNRFFDLSTNNSCCLKYSRYIEKYFYDPITTDSKWLNRIDDIVLNNNIDCIIPVLDKTTKRIVENEHLLKSRGKLCTLPELSSLRLAMDKGLLYKHLKSNNIPCPNSELISAETTNYHSKLSFPFIVKPTADTQGGSGVFLLKNQKEFIDYLKLPKKNHEILLQDFIEGFDVTCNVFCEKGKLLAYTMQKAALVKSVKVTPQTEFIFFNDDSLLELMEDLMLSLNWSGVANIDFRFDKIDKTYKVIEINPRFWFNTEASAMMNVNFPYILCLSSMQRKINFKPVENKSFVNIDGLLNRILINPLFIFKIKFIFNNTPIKFLLKDPLVVWCKFIWIINNVISSKILKKKMP